MPIYEYRCGECGQQAAEFRSVEDRDSVLACNDCDGAMLSRIIAAPRVWAPTRNGQ